ncbi:MAG: RpoL/Rpb11 RNA polymerase subunit family protein [Candidatus Micrarchaeia archaeon]
MEAHIIKKEDNELIIEFEDKSIVFPDFIADRLLTYSDVEFAGVNRDHPETGKPRLIIKTSKKKAKDVLKKALEDIEENLDDIKAQIKKQNK